jgi:hypothetical protein
VTEISARFDVKELAMATGLTVNNVRMLMDRMPSTLTTEQVLPGRGIARTFPIMSMKRAALISAVMKTGVGATQAARLVEAFSVWFEMNHKGLHANMDAYVARDRIQEIYALGYGKSLEWGNDWEFYASQLLDLNIPHEAKTGDMLMETIDNTYVFMSMLRPRMQMLDGPEMEAAFRVEGWERGGEMTITDASECEDELKLWQTVRENFTTKVVVNVSLAIRDAFEQVRRTRLPA